MMKLAIRWLSLASLVRWAPPLLGASTSSGVNTRDTLRHKNRNAGENSKIVEPF